MDTNWNDLLQKGYADDEVSIFYEVIFWNILKLKLLRTLTHNIHMYKKNE